MVNNPYQPPLGAGPASVSAGALEASLEGVSLVESLAFWMRFVGTFYVICTGLGLLALLYVVAMGGVGAIVGAVGIPLVVAGFAGGIWLRESGDQFRRGMASDDEGTLGAGFATLRKFWILFGIGAMASTAFSLLEVVS